MSLINALHTHLLLPFMERERHQGLARRMRYFADCERSSVKRNEELQWTQLVKLLRHAYTSTSFYRQRFEAIGFDPNLPFTSADVALIPPLTREDIRNRSADMCSRMYDTKELLTSATGGTTDTPVKFFRDRESVRDKTALQLRLNTWAGMYPGDKVFHLWGARSDYAQDPSWRWRFYDQRIMRHRWAPTSLLSREISESYRQDLNRFEPKIVYAYPTPLAIVCEHMREAGRPVHTPEAIICTAEALLDDQRKLIEETFASRIFEHYGSREFGMVAAECEAHAGLHVVSPAAYMEYIPVPDCDEPGVHEVLVTDLLNHGMPLVRYQVNDCVVLDGAQCSCGRGYPLIRKVIGRTTDIFQLPDGSKVPGVALTNRVLQVCPELKKVQVVQETIDKFRIRYVPGEGLSMNGLVILKQNLNKFFPHRLYWEFEQVEDIEREKSGKTRFCISKLTLNSRHASAEALGKGLNSAQSTNGPGDRVE